MTQVKVTLKPVVSSLLSHFILLEMHTQGFSETQTTVHRPKEVVSGEDKCKRKGLQYTYSQDVFAVDD